MTQIYLSALLLIILASNLSAQPGQRKTNLEIIDKGISSELERLLFLPGVERSKKFIFFISGYSEAYDMRKSAELAFITSIVRKTAEKNQLDYSIAKEQQQFETDSAYNKFKLIPEKIKTEYPKFIKNRFLGEKSIQRKIIAELVVEIINGYSNEIKTERIRVDFTDEIDYDGYEMYETDEYLFTKGAPPHVSEFETVIFPILLISVSAAATILFFTIRTK